MFFCEMSYGCPIRYGPWIPVAFYRLYRKMLMMYLRVLLSLVTFFCVDTSLRQSGCRYLRYPGIKFRFIVWYRFWIPSLFYSGVTSRWIRLLRFYGLGFLSHLFLIVVLLLPGLNLSSAKPQVFHDGRFYSGFQPTVFYSRNIDNV
jgi:hypothetical protein